MPWFILVKTCMTFLEHFLHFFKLELTIFTFHNQLQAVTNL